MPDPLGLNEQQTKYNQTTNTERTPNTQYRRIRQATTSNIPSRVHHMPGGMLATWAHIPHKNIQHAAQYENPYSGANHAPHHQFLTVRGVLSKKGEARRPGEFD
jgi:hypothetical protein